MNYVVDSQAFAGHRRRHMNSHVSYTASAKSMMREFSCELYSKCKVNDERIFPKRVLKDGCS